MTTAFPNLETALAALTVLLDDPTDVEADYQAWFEEHPVAFEILGYTEVLPHPVLKQEGQPDLIPDFLSRLPNGLWEIVELKLPSEPIVRLVAGRPQFYAKVTGYISQCRAYVHYFRDSGNRARFAEQYGINVQDDVRSVLFMGRLEQDDPRHFAELSANGPNLTILPYDELSATLEMHRQRMASHDEGGRGWSIHLVLAICELENQSNLILDVSAAIDRDRLTLSVDPDDILHLQLMDHEGGTHRTTAALQDLGLERNQFALLGIQIGSGERSTVVTLEVDGATRITRVFDAVEVNVDVDAFIWGADVDQSGSGSFLLASTAMSTEILSFADRIAVYRELDVEWHRAMAVSGSMPSHFDIVPGTCIISAKHPLKRLIRCGAATFHRGPDHDRADSVT